MQTDTPLHLLSTFQTFFPGQMPTHTVQAPGYETWAAALVTNDSRFTLACAELGGRVVVTWQSARRGETLNRRPLPPWAQLPTAVLVRLCAEGMDVPGMDLALMGEKPVSPRFEYGLGAAVAALLHSIHGRAYTPDDIFAIVEAAKRTK
ncbi:MAG: hypothetical protein MUF38_18510 [Anaerolineae bacterium]|nr:hypothetical protein [Anaerolineae bacterium]